MNYRLMPSLGHIALVKIAVTLWNKDDIKTKIKNYFSSLERNKNGDVRLPRFYKEAKEWLKIEEEVLKKATQLLMLPKCLREKLFGVVKPIGLELLNWMANHDKCTADKSCGLPNNLYWTSLGKLDIKKTVEILIKDKSIDIADRYALACIYCFEDDVRELWISMPKRKKAYFNSGKPVHNKLIVFWTYYLKGETAKLIYKMRDFITRGMCAYQLGFLVAVNYNNRLATEYFLKKLNPVEREKCIMKYYCGPDDSDVLCLLLSQMNDEERVAYFSRDETNTYNALRCLLEWPLQSFFKETFSTVCELGLLSTVNFNFLLKNIMQKVSKGIRDYNYQELFEQIWQLSPKDHKLYVLYDWAWNEHGSLVYDMANEGNIMLVLKDADIKMRERIIFSHISSFVKLIRDGKRDTIKIIIQECISSSNMMMKFKNDFITESFKEDFDDEFKESDSEFRQSFLNKFDQLMDELIDKKRSIEKDEDSHCESTMNKLFQSMYELSKKKRSIEEGECSQAKKPHTMKEADGNM